MVEVILCCAYCLGHFSWHKDLEKKDSRKDMSGCVNLEKDPNQKVLMPTNMSRTILVLGRPGPATKGHNKGHKWSFCSVSVCFNLKRDPNSNFQRRTNMHSTKFRSILFYFNFFLLISVNECV